MGSLSADMPLNESSEGKQKGRFSFLVWLDGLRKEGIASFFVPFFPARKMSV